MTILQLSPLIDEPQVFTCNLFVYFINCVDGMCEMGVDWIVRNYIN